MCPIRDCVVHIFFQQRPHSGQVHLRSHGWAQVPLPLPLRPPPWGQLLPVHKELLHHRGRGKAAQRNKRQVRKQMLKHPRSAVKLAKSGKKSSKIVFGISWLSIGQRALKFCTTSYLSVICNILLMLHDVCCHILIFKNKCINLVLLGLVRNPCHCCQGCVTCSQAKIKQNKRLSQCRPGSWGPRLDTSLRLRKSLLRDDFGAGSDALTAK